MNHDAVFPLQYTSRTAIKALFFYFNLCQSEKLDSLSCSFTSKSFLTKHNSNKRWYMKKEEVVVFLVIISNAY